VEVEEVVLMVVDILLEAKEQTQYLPYPVELQ
jgi:hypothetical protein